MNTTDRGPYITIVVFALLTLAGFYLLLDKTANLQGQIKDLELTIKLAEKNPAREVPSVPAPAPTSTPQSAPTTGSPASGDIVIPSAILFTASSSPLLAPQAELTATVESAVLSPDGTLTFSLKVFTEKAGSYSALEVKPLFELVELTGDNQLPTAVSGSFTSMPPKSSVSGSVEFHIPPNKESVILQINAGGDMQFYEFNFKSKTYRETVLG